MYGTNHDLETGNPYGAALHFIVGRNKRNDSGAAKNFIADERRKEGEKRQYQMGRI